MRERVINNASKLGPTTEPYNHGGQETLPIARKVHWDFTPEATWDTPMCLSHSHCALGDIITGNIPDM